MAMTYDDLATQSKQIYITQPKREILNWNFQNMIQWYLIKVPTITLSNLTQVAITYNDHSHSIQTVLDNSA